MKENTVFQLRTLSKGHRSPSSPNTEFGRQWMWQDIAALSYLSKWTPGCQLQTTQKVKPRPTTKQKAIKKTQKNPSLPNFYDILHREGRKEGPKCMKGPSCTVLLNRKMTIKLNPSGTRLQAWLTAPQINGQCSVGITNLVTVSANNVCEEQLGDLRKTQQQDVNPLNKTQQRKPSKPRQFKQAHRVWQM